MSNLATLATILPLLGALLGALAYYPVRDDTATRLAMVATTASVLASMAMAWVVFIALNIGALEPSTQHWFPWVSLSTWQVFFGVTLDKLSATMLIVVTTVSACVHAYSWGYMADDNSKPRFFIYLSLFTFAMLMLVTAPNLLQMFLGWEGVGVCSYLLIGFWHHKESANAAAMKAFIVNRVADAALLLGLFTLLGTFGSLAYADIFAGLATATTHTTNLLGWQVGTLNLAAVLIFIGAMGKSAQFGLHTWLPDAMEGPTPVSALIHAATMVTAGVFLLCRLSPLYELTPAVLHGVAWVGALTAIFAATVGLTQRDIKRVIAYSTCSQLGYMFFAIGVSAYPAAMFHLTTHAFFKALLFLGAGSVIHGMHHEQDIFKMGGLRKALPVTYALMWLGSLALAGIPPFAGFFSKDLILESAFMAPDGAGVPIYIVGTIAALLTAIYSFRVIFRTFFNKLPAGAHPHESPLSMLIPMLPLALGAVFAGFALHAMGTLGWWQGSIVISPQHNALENAHHIPLFFKYLPLVLAAAGIGFAYYAFTTYRGTVQKAARRLAPLYAFSFNKWYIDELYERVIIRPLTALAHTFYIGGDKLVIDHLLVNGTARTVAGAAQRLRRLQTGLVYHYAFLIIVGLTAMLAWFVWRAL